MSVAILRYAVLVMFSFTAFKCKSEEEVLVDLLDQSSSTCCNFTIRILT